MPAVRVEAGFHPRLNSFEQQRAVEMKWGRTGELARFLQVVPKHCVAQRDAYGPPPSVGPQSNMSSFRVKLVPKYLFTPIQVVPLTSLCLHRQSQDALPFVFLCNQLILCHFDICNYNLVPFKPLGLCS